MNPNLTKANSENTVSAIIIEAPVLLIFFFADVVAAADAPSCFSHN